MGDKVYDIFISCKEKNDEGERTVSSFIAEKIYNSLCIKGYNAFCSRRVLPGMAGTEYKPKIRQAMETSKLLVLVYTCAEEVVSNWVREEWMYFLSNKKSVLPVFMKKGIMHDYLMPHEISKLEHINLTDDKTGDMYELMLNRIDSIMSEFVNEIIADSHDVKEGKSFSKGNQKTTDSQNVDSESLYELGEMYENFYGEEHDYKKAFESFMKAAGLGHAEAMYKVGSMYYQGIGVKQDYTKAIKWFNRGIDAGSVAAMSELGLMYDEGDGVDQDFAKAIKLFTKAAEAGYCYAMANIGVMYEEGHGVNQSWKLALEWYTKAADAGNIGVMIKLAEMYRYGVVVKQNYSKTVEWYIKATNAGDKYAMGELAYMYENGEGVSIDYKEAIKWYTIASNSGDSSAMMDLGTLYEHKLHDYNEALHWYNRAILTGEQPGAELCREELKKKMRQ